MPRYDEFDPTTPNPKAAAAAFPGAIAQAADQKLSQLAPQLEKRLGRFEEMSNRIEQRITAAESTVIERMRTEAPKVLDAYTQQKIAQIQREAGRVQGSLPKR
jgi:hypothetical protein